MENFNGKISGKNFDREKFSHPERNTHKFRDRSFALMHHHAVRVAGTIVRNSPGNRDQLPLGRCYVLDAHRDGDAVLPAAVRGNPECLVGKRKDGPAMGNAARVQLAGTVHNNAGETIGCLRDLHA